MSDYDRHFYTSCETSLKLRSAGAPQDAHGATWWVDYHIGGGPELSDDTDPNETYCRAFRADEIIEALGDRFYSLRRGCDISYQVESGGWPADARGSDRTFFRASVVETLAAAWLAVLGAK